MIKGSFNMIFCNPKAYSWPEQLTFLDNFLKFISTTPLRSKTDLFDKGADTKLSQGVTSPAYHQAEGTPKIIVQSLQSICEAPQCIYKLIRAACDPRRDDWAYSSWQNFSIGIGCYRKNECKPGQYVNCFRSIYFILVD